MNLLRRSFIHSVKRFSVNSTLGEKFGYSSEDASYILERINDLNSLSGNLIGVAHKKKLDLYLKEKGQFNGLQDLLQVHGLGPKSIKRICDSLLSVRGDPEGINTTEHVSTKRFRLPVMYPPLTEYQASLIETVGSINIGTNEITWAKVNCISKNLDVWDSFDLDSSLISKKIDLLNLITICKEIVEKLPVCNTFVFEDLNLTSYGGNSGSAIPGNFLTAILSTLIHQPTIGGIPKVVLIGGRAVAKWSGRLVGSEKISSQSLMGDIIVKLNANNGMSMSNKTLPLLYAEPTLRSSYLSSLPTKREALADAILLALAFIDLAVNRRESMAGTSR